jgi:hypothetical protein
MIDLDELQRLHDAATPGPWKTDGPESVWTNTVDRKDAEILLRTPFVFKNDHTLETECCRCELCNANTALVVAMRNAMPAMIAEMRATRKVILGMALHMLNERGYPDAKCSLEHPEVALINLAIELGYDEVMA